MAGRKPGTPKTGGRQAGTPNKATPIRQAAQAYSNEALLVLVSIMRDEAAPHASRIAASNAIQDRGHGKPAQSIEMDIDAKVESVTEIRRTIVGGS